MDIAQLREAIAAQLPVPAKDINRAIAKHLIEQKVPSRLDDLCAYRSSEGKMCSVGCLIPDELYEDDMEGAGVGRLLADFPSIAVSLSPHENLLYGWQEFHDEHVGLEFDPAEVNKYADRMEKSL